MADVMSLERARQINAVLVEGWFIRFGIKQDPVPSLIGISLADAVMARNAVRDASPVKNQDGSVTLHCTVAEHRIPDHYAWMVCRRSGGNG